MDPSVVRTPPANEQENQEAINFRISVAKYQKLVAIVSVVLMAIGGSVFGLGVQFRPVLRLVWDHHRWIVSLGSDSMLMSGIFQIVNAGFCSFTANWRLYFPIYIGLSFTICLIVFELSSIVVTIYLASQLSTFVSEFVHRPWYIWECHEAGSCLEAYKRYNYFYAFPQVVLTVVAIILQCVIFYYLYTLLIVLKTRKQQIWGSNKRQSDDMEETNC